MRVRRKSWSKVGGPLDCAHQHVYLLLLLIDSAELHSVLNSGLAVSRWETVQTGRRLSRQQPDRYVL